MNGNTKQLFMVLLFVAIVGGAVYGYVFWKIRDANRQIATLSQETALDEKREKTFRSIVHPELEIKR